MLIRKLRWLGMEEEAQGLENELKRRRAAAADNVRAQLPKRINQHTGPPRLSSHVRSKKAAYCVSACFLSEASSHALLRLSPGASSEQPRKMPSLSRSFSNWQPFVRRLAKMKLTSNGQ